MTDYAKLIDGKTWAFIERTNSYYPPDAVDLDIAGQRAVYDAMCAQFYAGGTDGVVSTDEMLDGGDHLLPIRRYDTGAASPATVIYYHGGGFVVGGLHSHDDVCAEICARTGFHVVAVDYRLCPEHVHPAAFNDALFSYRQLSQRIGGRFVLAGDSAGGNLAAAVCHATRREIAPAGQVLIYPGLGGKRNEGSYLTHAEAPMLRAVEVDFYTSMRAGGKPWTGDPSFAPLHDTDFSGLPPTIVVSAQCDPLCDDGEAYCQVINAAGGKALCFEEKGMVHGYLRARHSVKRARDSFTRIVGAIDRLGKGQWGY